MPLSTGQGGSALLSRFLSSSGCWDSGGHTVDLGTHTPGKIAGRALASQASSGGDQSWGSGYRCRAPPRAPLFQLSLGRNPGICQVGPSESAHSTGTGVCGQVSGRREQSSLVRERTDRELALHIWRFRKSRVMSKGPSARVVAAPREVTGLEFKGPASP